MPHNREVYPGRRGDAWADLEFVTRNPRRDRYVPRGTPDGEFPSVHMLWLPQPQKAEPPRTA